ncbi:helix-turn-helix transcriptional regulator [Streptomyces cinnamoneus]
MVTTQFSPSGFRTRREAFNSRNKTSWALGISPEAIKAYEDGRSLPSVRVLARAADVFGVNIADFFIRESVADAGNDAV